MEQYQFLKQTPLQDRYAAVRYLHHTFSNTGQDGIHCLQVCAHLQKLKALQMGKNWAFVPSLCGEVMVHYYLVGFVGTMRVAAGLGVDVRGGERQCAGERGQYWQAIVSSCQCLTGAGACTICH